MRHSSKKIKARAEKIAAALQQLDRDIAAEEKVEKARQREEKKRCDLVAKLEALDAERAKVATQLGRKRGARLSTGSPPKAPVAVEHLYDRNGPARLQPSPDLTTHPVVARERLRGT